MNVEYYLKRWWKHTKSDCAEINGLAILAIFSLGVFFGFTLQSALTGVVAGTTALIIAFVAYPWQKERDRKNELRKEQGEAYRRFFKAYMIAKNLLFSKTILNSTPSNDALSDALKAKSDLDQEFLGLSIVGCIEIINAASTLNDLIHDILRELTNELSTLPDDPVDGLPVESAVIIFEQVIKSKVVVFDRHETELVNLIRDLEFDGTGRLTISSRRSEKTSSEAESER